MGGDHGPSVIVPAVLHSAKQHPNIHFILVGDQAVINAALTQANQCVNHDRITIHHASECVTMHEHPVHALKRKKNSSMRLCVDLVKAGTVHACVSAGNTGALLAIAHYVLRTLPGVNRAGLITSIITKRKGQRVYMIDLGANVDSTPKHLHDFAVMGSVMLAATQQITSPKVGLLSNGHEDVKGNQLAKKTAGLLDKSSLNYVGYIEANNIMDGDIDLVVCDGFVGNVTLKTMEGTTHFLKQHLNQAIQNNLLLKIIAFMLKPILKTTLKELNPQQYNGASLLGLNGIVIKSHGGANIEGFSHAINEAVREANQNISELIRDKISNHASETSQ